MYSNILLCAEWTARPAQESLAQIGGVPSARAVGHCANLVWDGAIRARGR